MAAKKKAAAVSPIITKSITVTLDTDDRDREYTLAHVVEWVEAVRAASAEAGKGVVDGDIPINPYNVGLEWNSSDGCEDDAW